MGECLVVQVAAIPYMTVATHTVVMDRNGDVARLSLYNFSSSNKPSRDLSAELPMGAVLVIKEPWVKVGSLYSWELVGQPGLTSRDMGFLMMVACSLKS